MAITPTSENLSTSDEKLNVILQEVYERFGPDLGKFLESLPDTSGSPRAEQPDERSLLTFKKK